MLDTDGLDMTSTSDSRRTQDDASLHTLTLSLDSPGQESDSVCSKILLSSWWGKEKTQQGCLPHKEC